jgi:hypothetical protein
MIDQAIATAKFAQRIHPDFTLVGKGREMLMTKLMRRWQTTEPERRAEVSAVIIACYIMGYQYGFDAAIEAMHEYDERRKLV